MAEADIDRQPIATRCLRDDTLQQVIWQYKLVTYKPETLRSAASCRSPEGITVLNGSPLAYTAAKTRGR